MLWVVNCLKTEGGNRNWVGAGLLRAWRVVTPLGWASNEETRIATEPHCACLRQFNDRFDLLTLHPVFWTRRQWCVVILKIGTFWTWLCSTLFIWGYLVLPEYTLKLNSSNWTAQQAGVLIIFICEALKNLKIVCNHKIQFLWKGFYMEPKTVLLGTKRVLPAADEPF